MSSGPHGPYLVYPRLSAVGDTTLAYALLNLGIRLLVWGPDRHS